MENTRRDKKTELLIGAYRLLNLQVKNDYTLNLLNCIIECDDSECTGRELMDDIQYHLEKDGIDIGSLT